ncbi:MAG: glycine betaine ABC transporter substrate-binding protein [Lachnospiraceae bacterium]
MNIVQYIAENAMQIATHLLKHIQLTGIAVGLSLLIGVPLGVLICYVKKLSKPILAISNVIQAIPSMALLGFMIPILGIGVKPAVIAVMLYSLLPIIKNTYTGINNINVETVESAMGIGLTKFQILWKVQIPLALPVIMAGVRISAVTAVGLVTIAAFIGAGGLGFLVFSGIRTVNNMQIFAGAIPACLLALAVDYLAGIVEKLVTPISLQKSQKDRKSLVDRRKTRRNQKIILGTCVVLLAGLFAYTHIQSTRTSDRTLTIGGKDFTEQSIVANLAALMIENETDITVNKMLDLGGTQVCFSALKAGEIDMYIEYSGTAYGDTLGLPLSSDMELVYQTVKDEFKEQFDIVVLPQMAFNNTYTLTVTSELAEEMNLVTISDLAKVAGQLRLGSTLEFLNRDDGYPGIKKLYDFEFSEVIGIDGSARYVALMNGKVDVVDAYSTDGLIKKFGLTILEDDKSFFPPYYAIPIIRNAAYEEFPEVEAILERLGAVLTNEVMVELNYKVDELQMNAVDVAREFLQEMQML